MEAQKEKLTQAEWFSEAPVNGIFRLLQLFSTIFFKNLLSAI
ncbi:hypothetical protein SD77_3963 [Bacillus badius]|uniref:Uncharacterized protein n=1 Tax=Bacillus badius TaxID=1455 RepID=A0ABR5AU77_BACBA|nr:hypothetical protein SD78_0887 [Bacillus badius]KIL78283.1 hypothetical protein SD77_3963 [Bacillus badius]